VAKTSVPSKVTAMVYSNVVGSYAYWAGGGRPAKRSSM